MTNPDAPARLTKTLTVEKDLPRRMPLEDPKTHRWFMPSVLVINYASTYTDPPTEGAESATTAEVQGLALDGKTKKPLHVTYNDETGFPEGVVEYVAWYDPDKTD